MVVVFVSKEEGVVWKQQGNIALAAAAVAAEAFPL